MQILVDDIPYHACGPRSQTVQDLANEICGQESGADGRLVIALSADGRNVSADQLTDVLARPMCDFQTIAMQTVTVREQIEATLQQGLEVLTDAHETRVEAADALNQGQHQTALAGIQRLLEVFRQVQQTALLAAQLLGIDLEQLRLPGASITEVLQGMKDQLGELKSGMESQDFVLVSDLLRYQLGESLDAWRSILECLLRGCSPSSPEC